jgi:solute:Na+ symporter, SSS family
LNTIDYTVIAVYLSFLIGLGLYLRKRASASLEDYFLGGRKLPWWALGISGMASFLDITGTVLIVSFLYILGPRGLFIEFRGGAVLVLAVFLLWTGKWQRRSGCMTGAEWMIYRFGEGRGGQAARILKAVSEVIFTIGMLTYMAKGVGIFLNMFLPFSPAVCSIMLIGVAALYTMISGFYGVVFTDMIQSAIILIAVITISAMAIFSFSDTASLNTIAQQVTGAEQWASSVPHWNTPTPQGYEKYHYLFMFALFYLFRNILYGMGFGDDPKYFGARSDRECGSLTFLWTCLMMFRWPMMMGFAVLGIFLVHKTFPDQKVLLDTSQAVKQYYVQQSYPDNPAAHTDEKILGQAIPKTQWDQKVSDIINSPDDHKEIVAKIKTTLGEEQWTDKLKMVSYEGIVNPERILPSVILFKIPLGFRGLLLVALLAASMSTFDSTANRGAGFFTRDLYQRYLRPKAGNRELILSSWFFILIVAAAALICGNFVENINDIWEWIAMGYGAGMIVPMFLRFYWWRFTGIGFAVGMAAGITGAILQRIFLPDIDPRIQFTGLLGVGLVSCVLGTYLSPCPEQNVLEHFYKTTRPFGFWGHLKKTVSPQFYADMRKEHRNDIISLPFALGWQVCLFLLPMQLIIRAWTAFGVTFVIFLGCLGGMYLFWYRNLPEDTKE